MTLPRPFIGSAMPSFTGLTQSIQRGRRLAWALSELDFNQPTVPKFARVGER
jgi:hypothetical protein